MHFYSRVITRIQWSFFSIRETNVKTSGKSVSKIMVFFVAQRCNRRLEEKQGFYHVAAHFGIYLLVHYAQALCKMFKKFSTLFSNLKIQTSIQNEKKNRKKNRKHQIRTRNVQLQSRAYIQHSRTSFFHHFTFFSHFKFLSEFSILNITSRISWTFLLVCSIQRMLYIFCSIWCTTHTDTVEKPRSKLWNLCVKIMLSDKHFKGE